MNVCQHLQPGTYPLVIDRVIDDHLGFTDAIAHCRECGSALMLEMLDWRGRLRLFRVSVLDEELVARLLRDLDRGSCDLDRAGSQIAQFQQMHADIDALLLLDTGVPEILALTAAGAERLPRSGWRELPCDGSRITRLLEPR